MIMADSIIGQRFGMLTILSEEEPGTDTRGHRFRRFRCHCDCGNEKTVNYNNILCGCEAADVHVSRKILLLILQASVFTI